MIIQEFIEILRQFQQHSELSEQRIEDLTKIFSNETVTKVKEIIDLQKIGCYKIENSDILIWSAKGKKEQYFLVPLEFCSCVDFYINGILKKEQYLCKHLISQAIYASLNKKKSCSKKKLIEAINLFF